jgi:hypothetical protein
MKQIARKKVPRSEEKKPNGPSSPEVGCDAGYSWMVLPNRHRSAQLRRYGDA